jgi:two-component system nitrogen regulation response regulator GlnG
VRHFLANSGFSRRVVKRVSAAAMQQLLEYDWPGNVRQLVNATRRMMVTAPGCEITAADVPAEIGGTATDAGTPAWVKELDSWARRHLAGSEEALLAVAVPEFERVLIRAALARSGGRRQDASRLLGWGRNTLTRKLRELGMED